MNNVGVVVMMKILTFLLKSVDVGIEHMGVLDIVRLLAFITVNLGSVTITECVGKNVHSVFLILIMGCVLIVN